MEFPVKELMALFWHATDGALQMRGSSHKKARAMWVGIGVGWSLFWIVKYYTKPRLVEIRPYKEIV